MIRCSLREVVAFHDDKGTPDDYCPSVNLGELRQLLKREDHLTAALATALEENNTTTIDWPGAPGLPEDYKPGTPIRVDNLPFKVHRITSNRFVSLKEARETFPDNPDHPVP